MSRSECCICFWGIYSYLNCQSLYDLLGCVCDCENVLCEKEELHCYTYSKTAISKRVSNVLMIAAVAYVHKTNKLAKATLYASPQRHPCNNMHVHVMVIVTRLPQPSLEEGTGKLLCICCCIDVYIWVLTKCCKALTMYASVHVMVHALRWRSDLYMISGWGRRLVRCTVMLIASANL